MGAVGIDRPRLAVDMPASAPAGADNHEVGSAGYDIAQDRPRAIAPDSKPDAVSMHHAHTASKGCLEWKRLTASNLIQLNAGGLRFWCPRS